MLFPSVQSRGLDYAFKCNFAASFCLKGELLISYWFFRAEGGAEFTHLSVRLCSLKAKGDGCISEGDRLFLSHYSFADFALLLYSIKWEG